MTTETPVVEGATAAEHSTPEAGEPLDGSAWEPRFEAFLAVQWGATVQDPGHDLAHVRRVVANTRHLAGLEGARTDIAVPAAWLHDCVLVAKDSLQRPQASRLAGRAAQDWLLATDCPRDLVGPIRHAIEAHSHSAQIEPRTVEARVVQDADRLDALGSIGISRCLLVGHHLGLDLYHPTEPLPVDRPADDTRFVLDHFYVKLLGLADTMKTHAGRREAERRVASMRRFLDDFRREVEGLGSRP